MKILLTILVLFFTSLSLNASRFLFDIKLAFKWEYEIISVNIVNQNDVLYILQNNENELIHCLYTLEGEWIDCVFVYEEKQKE